MTITIIRRFHTPWGVVGTLVMKELSFCSTMEHPVNLLPVGEYEIEYATNKLFCKKMPMIKLSKQQVAAFKSLSSHKGRAPKPSIQYRNGPLRNTDGSICVGQALIPGVLMHTREYYDLLVERIRKCSKKKESMKLIIKEED